MTGAILNFLGRDELEAEVLRLRAALEEAGIDPRRPGPRRAGCGARDSLAGAPQAPGAPAREVDGALADPAVAR
ncbi:hypothetical protein, partial [Methylobacterium crusticola]